MLEKKKLPGTAFRAEFQNNRTRGDAAFAACKSVFKELFDAIHADRRSLYDFEVESRSDEQRMVRIQRLDQYSTSSVMLFTIRRSEKPGLFSSMPIDHLYLYYFLGNSASDFPAALKKINTFIESNDLEESDG